MALGAVLAVQPQVDQLFPEFQEQQDQEGNTDGPDEYVLGSAHEHALFHVVINDTEKDFSSQRFQFNSRYVHLENNRSSIVHKHADGVRWSHFLSTINVSVNSTNQTSVCIEVYDNRSCGPGAVILNQEINSGLDREITQGDNLLLIIGDNWREKAREYMEQELPEDYKPQRNYGRSV